MSHQCPAPWCDAEVRDDQLACRADWFRIPKPYRQAVWATWQHGEGAGSLEHRRALSDAVQALERAGQS